MGLLLNLFALNKPRELIKELKVFILLEQSMLNLAQVMDLPLQHFSTKTGIQCLYTLLFCQQASQAVQLLRDRFE